MRLPDDVQGVGNCEVIFVFQTSTKTNIVAADDVKYRSHMKALANFPSFWTIKGKQRDIVHKRDL